MSKQLLSDGQFEELTDQLVEIVEKQETINERLDFVEKGNRMRDRSAITKLGAGSLGDIGAKIRTLKPGEAFRAVAQARHGKAAQESLRQFGRFLKACVLKARNGSVPAEFQDLNREGWLDLTNRLPNPSDADRAKASYDTVVDATAGYLVPQIWWPEISALKQLYGAVISQCRTITVRAGQLVHIGSLGEPTATWVGGQNVALTESSPSAAQLSLRPSSLGAISTISNELLELPETEFAQIWGEELVKAIVKAEETALLAGETSVDDSPHNGLLVASAVNSQPAIATMSFSNLISFITLCLADSDEATAAGNILVMHPKNLLTLYTEATTSHWNPIENDVFVSKFPVFANHAMLVGSDYYVALFQPLDYWVAQWPGLRVEFDPYAKFDQLSTRCRVVEWIDYGLPRAAATAHHAVVTA